VLLMLKSRVELSGREQVVAEGSLEDTQLKLSLGARGYIISGYIVI